MNDFHSSTFDVGTKNHLDYKALDLPQVILEYNQKYKSAKTGARLGGNNFNYFRARLGASLIEFLNTKPKLLCVIMVL